ncbi:hypothetical protein H6F67_25750 [Microcoleus sp. FACHB-1515]|uniref:hypothetical protein n=1 Tax=Cyanophyceae TaxID=3028117 RepID=UPI0016843C77|nr:hypothetical protein [Microcoleus sp. FACHB-1515]MBD2093253.1 hypothetical protein [Microcoleus sp. FACHB-1515]
MAKTIRLKDGTLRVPVFDGSASSGKGEFLEPVKLANTLLQDLFDLEELRSLLIVKIDQDFDNPGDPKHLCMREFDDGNLRQLAFSSGKNYYYADRALKDKINQLFDIEPDKACNYGSLLTSNCHEGGGRFAELRVKLVDYQDPKFARYKTNDCHGKAAPWIVEALGGSSSRPFQFRLGYRDQAAAHSEDAPPGSFIAKGTLLQHQRLCEQEDCDIILDRSSIKPKRNLDCRTYTLPLAALGNRSNARNSQFNCSWQFIQWFSPDAVRTDFGPATARAAQQLRDLQKDPRRLIAYLIEQHDQRKQHSGSDDSIDTPDDNDDRNSTEQREDTKMIRLLRSDRLGLLTSSPRFGVYLERATARAWNNLASKSAVKFRSGMAIPASASELDRSQVCIPGVPDGEIVLLTRYPIINRDNIRKYVNVAHPTLSRLKGTIAIRGESQGDPGDAAEFHQMDFDGDEAAYLLARDYPNVARECYWAGANAKYDFDPVTQRPKQSYLDIRDEQGDRKYRNLASIAVASSNHSVGRIANYIGRVQCSSSNPREQPKQFRAAQRSLLNRCFDGLQVEVDYGKSALRIADTDPMLIDDCIAWKKQHPVPFFDFLKHPDCYRKFPLPAVGESSVDLLAREAVNPQWEAARLQKLDRHYFQFLFEPPRNSNLKDWAAQVSEEVKRATSRIRRRCTSSQGRFDRDQFQTELGDLYQAYEEKVNRAFPPSAPNRRMQAAAALWHEQHKMPSESVDRKKSLQSAQGMKITFEFEQERKLPNRALPIDTHVLTVPFQKPLTDGNGDSRDRNGPLYWRESLQAKGIEFVAVVNPNLPVVEFILPNLREANVQLLDRRFGGNDLDPTFETLPDRIVPPTEYKHWTTSEQEPSQGALVYNLFTEEICQRLETYQIHELLVQGIDRNAYANTNFHSSSWRTQTIELTVEPYQLDPNHPEFDRYSGVPALTLNGKFLGMFTPQSPKLPIGSRIEATIEPQDKILRLHTQPDRVYVPPLEAQTDTATLSVNSLRRELQQVHDETQAVRFRLGPFAVRVDAADRSFTAYDEQRNPIWQGAIDRAGQDEIPLSSTHLAAIQIAFDEPPASAVDRLPVQPPAQSIASQPRHSRNTSTLER